MKNGPLSPIPPKNHPTFSSNLTIPIAKAMNIMTENLSVKIIQCLPATLDELMAKTGLGKRTIYRRCRRLRKICMIAKYRKKGQLAPIYCITRLGFALWGSMGAIRVHIWLSVLESDSLYSYFKECVALEYNTTFENKERSR